MMMFDDKVGEKNDTWNIRSLGNQPSNQAYYIEDCQISGQKANCDRAIYQCI